MYINNVCCFSPCYLHQDLLVHLDTLYSCLQRVGGAKIALLLLLFFCEKEMPHILYIYIYNIYIFFFFV